MLRHGLMKTDVLIFSAELWKQANDEVEKLFALIDKVRAKMDKKSSGNSPQQPARLDLRQCTWEHVLGEVQSAATRWSTTPKKSSKIMTFLDKLGRNSDAFKSWLELIPDGDYGSRYFTHQQHLAEV